MWCFFLAIYLVQVLHFSVAQSGYTLSFYALGTALGSFIGGYMTDRWSPRTVSLIAPLLRGVIYFILVFSTTFWVINPIVLLLGLTGYAFSVSNSAEVLSHCPNAEALVQALSILRVATNVAFGFAGLLGGILATQYGFRVVFLTLGGGALIGNLIRIFQKQPEDTVVASLSQASSCQENEERGKTKSLIFIVVLSVVFFVNLIYAQVSSTYPIYIAHHFSVRTFAFFMSFNTIFVAFFSVPIHHYFKRRNKMMGLGLGGLLLGIGMLLLIFSSNLVWVFGAWGLFTLGEIIFLPMAQEICYVACAPKKKGQALGWYRGMTAVSRTIGPVLGGGIYHHFGALFVWIFCGVIGFASFMIGLLCKKHVS